jgi:hypothetical protein
MTARTYRLTALHQKLDEALQRESTRRAPNPFTLMALKRRKLRVKDLLTRFAPSALRG